MEKFALNQEFIFGIEATTENIKQWSFKSKKIIKTWPLVTDNPITALWADNMFLFIGDESGQLIQYTLTQKIMIAKKYGKLFEGHVKIIRTFGNLVVAIDSINNMKLLNIVNYAILYDFESFYTDVLFVYDENNNAHANENEETHHVNLV